MIRLFSYLLKVAGYRFYNQQIKKSLNQAEQYTRSDAILILFITVYQHIGMSNTKEKNVLKAM